MALKGEKFRSKRSGQKRTASRGCGPFFLAYPLTGYKGIQYNIWLEAVLLTLGTTKY